jgi:ABC-type multidrug transport system fused ATPase/permease subunit
MRAWMKSLLSLVLVTLTGYLLDRLLRYEGVPGRDLLFLSDFLVGLVAAILVFVMSEFENRKRKAVAERLKVIAEMNHHIRNALQVIAYQSSFREDKKEIGSIDDAVNRISWALRELLPQLPPEL